MIADVLFGKAVENPLPVNFEMGDDGVEGDRLGVVENPQLGGFELGLLDADAACGFLAVVEELGQLDGGLAAAVEAVLDIADPGPLVAVRFGP